MKTNKSILLVEDDPNFGSILIDYLSLHSFDIVLAKNGIEGLEKFKKYSYDLCILDVMMPFKDGFSLATMQLAATLQHISLMNAEHHGFVFHG